MFRYLRITSRSAALTLLAALTLCVPLSAMAASADSRGDIVVVTVHGTVTATMAGMTVPLMAVTLLAAGLSLDTLSMGMTADLEAAVHAGSTMVRVGTAIFGARARSELLARVGFHATAALGIELTHVDDAEAAGGHGRAL